MLLEDVHGVGKTTLAKALAKTLTMDFARVQFTPDLLPTDILGASILDPQDEGRAGSPPSLQGLSLLQPPYQALSFLLAVHARGAFSPRPVAHHRRPLDQSPPVTTLCAFFDPHGAALGGALDARAFSPPRRGALGLGRRTGDSGRDDLFLPDLVNHGERLHQALRIEGPFLPWDGTYVGAAPGASELAHGERVTVTVRATFIERGEHHLDPFEVKATVPLGLTTSCPVASGAVRFTVVPRIAPIRRLRIPLGQRYQPGGVALASRTGESMELMGVRPYRPGDPIRDLHAKSWARRGKPVVREYQQEYFSRVGVILDSETSKRDDWISNIRSVRYLRWDLFVLKQSSALRCACCGTVPKRTTARGLHFLRSSLTF